jgi:hypothetical protein
LEAAGDVANHLNELSGMGAKEADPKVKLERFSIGCSAGGSDRVGWWDRRGRPDEGVLG